MYVISIIVANIYFIIFHNIQNLNYEYIARFVEMDHKIGSCLSTDFKMLSTYAFYQKLNYQQYPPMNCKM